MSSIFNFAIRTATSLRICARQGGAIGLLLVGLCASPGAWAQGVLVGPENAPPDPSALLHLDNTPYPAQLKRGMMLPAVELTRTDAPDPVGPLPLPPSLMVYNSATTALTGSDAQYNVYPGYYWWEGSRWLRFEAGVGRQSYINCSRSASGTAPYTVATIAPNWLNNTSGTNDMIRGMSIGVENIGNTSTPFVLYQGDRVFLEASGAVQLAGTPSPDLYNDVEIEIVYNRNAATNFSNPIVLARTRVSLDLRSGSAGSSFLFGLFSTQQSGFGMQQGVQNFSLQAHVDIPVDGVNTGEQYKFWVRARRTRNIGVVTTGGTDGNLRGCLRMEVFRH